LEGLTVGRIVHFVIREWDANRINRRRTNSESIKERMAHNEWNLGAQAHIGTSVEEGEEYPMIIVKVLDKERGVVRGQVFLDGNDVYWVEAIYSHQDEPLPGSWHWVERE